MSAMADPHQGMISFQKGLHEGILELHQVPKQHELFAHFDEPEPGVRRLTYVRLTNDRRTVRAFLNCLMNGMIDGSPCMAVGYAVPENLHRQGLAKQLFRDVVQDQIAQAGNSGFGTICIEAVIDVNNIASQHVAEAVLGGERESITDSHSGLPAYRYTAGFDTASGRQI